MDIARDKAWSNAVWLADLQGDELKKAIQELDTSVTNFSQAIYHPGCIFSPILKIIELFEVKDVREVIDDLST